MHVLRTGLALLAALAVGMAGVLGFAYLAPERATAIVIDADRARSGLTRKEIELPGGLRYAYLEGGSGTPLMLLHGFGANKDNFTRVARFLTPHYRMIVPDLIGFGESSHPAQGDYSPLAQAHNLRRLAQALGVNALHLGGSSMGGQIALTYAALYPDQVRSLWLLAPAGIWSAPLSDLAKSVRDSGHNNLLATNEDEYAELFTFVMNDPPYIPRLMKDVMAQEGIRNHALQQRIFEQIKNDRTEDRIRGLQTPALIVWGERDRALHVGGAAVLHRLLPQSQVLIMPGVGHLPMVERVKESAAAYLKFRTAHP